MLSSRVASAQLFSPAVLRLKSLLTCLCSSSLFARALSQPGTEGVFRTNNVIIETVKSMTKIETKRLLEAVYGVEVAEVHSLIRRGKRRSEQTVQAYKKKDFKRFYVKLSTAVDLPNVPKPLEEASSSAAKGN